MIYKSTKLEVLKELRVKIIKQENLYELAKFAENLLQEKIKDNDQELEQFLIDLTCMQAGQEHALSYEQLEEMFSKFYMGDDFLYDRLEFAKELRQHVRKKTLIDSISQWAYNVWMWKETTNDDILKDIAYHLSMMCCDECFEYSYDELNDIAHRLIIGEEVKL